jgi:hypothetical protein
VTGDRKCEQCGRLRPYPKGFIGRRGKPVNFCTVCQGRYSNWANKTIDEKLAARGARVDSPPAGRMLFTMRSLNVKTGPIPVSISERGTCPSTCSMYEAGCYASYGKLGAHWKGKGTAAHAWISWQAFVARVGLLRPGQLWRHNEAGDLAGAGTALDYDRLGELVAANRGRRGFTYTPQAGSRPLRGVPASLHGGFHDQPERRSLAHADVLAGQQEPMVALPMTVILPADAPDKGIRTPVGRPVVVCPAQTTGITCRDCQLCAEPFRKSVVGFRAHGQASALVPEIVRRRLPMLSQGAAHVDA